MSTAQDKIQKPNEEEMLRRIMEQQFITVELNLFLDTHPENQEAISDMRQASDALQLLIREYELAFGPLLGFGLGVMGERFEWIRDPWPWERTWRRRGH